MCAAPAAAPCAGLAPSAVGLGWRQPHYQVLMNAAHWREQIDFLEVHSENFLAPASASRVLLQDMAQQRPISLHGVGLGLGSAGALDAEHLAQLRDLVQDISPALLSEHACFTRAHWGGRWHHAHDLLPLPWSASALAHLAAQVAQAQHRLGRALLLENLSNYLQWQGEEPELAEPEFFNRLCAQEGCGLLLDLNNLLVNALNDGLAQPDALAYCRAWIEAIEPQHVGQYHLAGHSAGPDLVVDDHGSAVPEPVWALYRHALRRIGPRPTLIEWDNNIPELSVLLEQVRLARQHQQAVQNDLPQTAPPKGLVLAHAESPSPSTDASTSTWPQGQRQLLQALRQSQADLPASWQARRGVRGAAPRALLAYRQHAAVLAQRVLAQRHPVLMGLMEAQEPGSFARMAWQAWREDGPSQGDVDTWCGPLQRWLAAVPSEQAQAWALLAQLEGWVQAAERLPHLGQNPAELQQLWAAMSQGAEDWLAWRLRLAPHLRFLALPEGVLGHWGAWPQAPADTVLSHWLQAPPGLPWCSGLERPELAPALHLAVWRAPSAEVCVAPLPAALGSWLEALQAGQCLGEALSALHPESTAGQAALALLPAWWQWASAQAWVWGFRPDGVGDQHEE
ncbi:DUF692 family multinuclear iron-containing protein [Roseateles sp. BYS180W]|uniref:DUF692 family multinuclear iron-containing protein n=1 Tax=Roseateles rivi TaxID=3299028 RepID=A0ABW7FY09_9BURK